MNASALVPAVLVLALAGCSPQPDAVSHDIANAPSDAFMSAVAAHCGKAFEGRIAVNEPKTDAPDPFEGKRLVMHVRGCEDPAHELRIPFHVGDDHSRTWVLTRTENGVRLKHDHRHEDGSPDAVTMYGGDSKPPGTAERQSFPVDSDSVAMFRKADMLASVQNTWAMDVEPDQRFVYELTRPGGRHFQVVFDLSKPVALPPAPWGSETPAP
ncbi:hypothetical protein EDF74_2489 [Stenotrophomonas rhizophila]|uniref:hypothetical protein n=1 Tax=Stenotrophomonas rhizophila TaxID=216778 RepID=UPI000F4AFAD3|nr:hypothetical protein [Stenotrophomonas rhizophila]ROP76829.1 hypothetical protein EDF74_2489 [Stenotrophomonas rhizophila]